MRVRLVVLGLVILLFSGPAEAGECLSLPECDQDNPACNYCPTEEPPQNQWSAEQQAFHANFVESPGGKIGIAATYEAMVLMRANAQFQNTPSNLTPGWNASGWVQGTSAEFEAELQALIDGGAFEAGTLETQAGRPHDPSTVLPFDQSIARPGSPSGLPNDTPHARYGTEPINPANGEFYIEELDLSFPGFGVAYQHLRTYRSRVDYEGPMGYGWDHLHNQRLVYTANPPVGSPVPAIDVDLVAENPTAPPAADSSPPELVSSFEEPDPGPCGPELRLTTGHATTITFREAAHIDGGIRYTGEPNLILEGQVEDAVTTWTLTARDGERRHFDHRGLLVRWTDSNDVGLTLEWEEGAGRLDWRLARVTDSVGRVVSYHYDNLDRLILLHEPSSDLATSYVYDDRNDLVAATSSNGRSELYEYDFDASRIRGDWASEWLLPEACELACAPSTSSCDAGGACDAPVAQATEQCLAGCGECSSDCRAECPAACGDACRGDAQAPGCTAMCESECQSGAFNQQIADTCQEAWDEFGAAACNSCGAACDTQGPDCRLFGNCIEQATYVSNSDGTTTVNLDIAASCLSGGGAMIVGDFLVDFVIGTLTAAVEALGCGLSAIACSWHSYCDVSCDGNSIVDQYEELCNQNYDTCCEDGVECGPSACNAGHSCHDDCRAVFFGHANGNQCASFSSGGVPIEPPAVVPTYGTTEYAQLVASLGTVDDWATIYGCLPTMQASCANICSRSCVSECAAECVPACGDECDEACNLADCAGFCDSLDLMGQCQDGCTSGCVAAAHETGPFVGPKYGHPADLNHNLVRIYDGNGDLYLENVYGQDLASPSHDAVVQQFYGEHPVELSYRDLEGEAAGFIDPPAGPAASLSDSLAAYESVEICPGDCPASSPPDVVVPSRDLLVVFEQPLGHSEAGLPVTSPASAGEVMPTAFELRQVSNGVLATPFGGDSISPRRISLSLRDGAIELGRRRDGSYLATGSSRALSALAAMRTLTVLSDRQGTLRVYPGMPRGALHVASGSCDRPFVARPVSQHEIELEPADACSSTLLVAPLASEVRDSSLLEELRRAGGHLPGRNLYLGSVLAPSREMAIWREGETTGRFSRSKASSRSSATTTRDLALWVFEQVPITNGWTRSDRAPVYVFHVAPEAGPTDFPERDVTTVFDPVIPTDDPFVEVDEFYEPPCDPSVPGPARRGSGESAPGPKPSRASVLVDFHGVAWTYYFDPRGQLLRVVNHDTGATRSYNYDSTGYLTAHEDPEGARTCIERDGVGNPTRVMSLPAPGSPGTSQPITTRYSYTAFPHRLRRVWDPRDSNGTPLVTYQWDASGNLLGMTDAAGDTTVVELVGGAGPDRAMPGRVVGSDGSATDYIYDVGSGTLDTVVLDAGGVNATTLETVHDAAGRPVWATTALGEILTWEWQQGRLHAQTRSADGLLEFLEYGYDSDAQVVSINRGDRLTSLTYDPIGNPRTITETVLDGSGQSRTTCVLAGPNRRLLEVVQPEGTRVRVSYDGEGRTTLVEAGSWASAGATWDDACPAQLADITPAAGIVEETTYDLAGRPTMLIDASAVPTTVRYDGHGRAVEVTRGTLVVRTGPDELGNPSWQAAYDAAHLPGSFSAPWTGQTGLLAASSHFYDEVGRLERTDAWHFDDQGQAIGDGIARTTYAYDPAGRRITVTDDTGATTVAEYDPLGRLTRQILGNGAQIVTSYADGGRTVSTKRPAPTPTGFAVTTTQYTAWGAPSAVLSGDGDASSLVATWSYDAHRRPIASWSAGGGSRSTAYDAFDRPVREEAIHDEGSTEVLRYVWDRNDWLRSRHSDSGTVEAATVFNRDALGRVQQLVEPDGARTQLFYDGAHPSPSIVLDPAEYTHHRSYDANGNLARIRTLSPATGDLDHWREYIHDPLGRLVEAFDQRYPDWSADEVRTYLRWDSLGNKLAEWDSSFGTGGGVAHAHDARGLPVQSTIAGTTVRRSYDAVGRLTDLYLGNEASPSVSVTWPQLGPPVQRTLGNGIVTTYDYDRHGRLVGQSDTLAGNLISQQSWEVPLDGVPRFSSFYGIGLPETASAYRADDAGRLLVEAHDLGSLLPGPLSADAGTDQANEWAAQLLGGSSPREYALDGRHNWTAVTGDGLNLTPSVGFADQYQQLAGVSPSYDARGGLLSDGDSSYAYNALGELIAVYGPEASREYRRDALGRIVRELDPETGDLTRIAYDGAQRIALRHPDGSVERFIGGPALDQHHIRVGPGGVRDYVHQDRLGNVYLMTDASGNPLEWYRYTAYGETSILDPLGQPLATSAIGNRFTFQGQLADHGTGLIDMRARAYLPTWGRFLSRDPLGLLGGTNLYAFVDGAPLLWTDPLGLRKGQAYDICNVGCHSESPQQQLERELRNARYGEEDNSGLLTRFLGFVRMAGGTVEAGGGALLMYVPGAQPLGAFLFVHGSDHAGAGFWQLVTGDHTRTATSHAIEHVGGVSPETADTVDGGLGLIAGSVGLYRTLTIPPSSTLIPLTDDVAGAGGRWTTIDETPGGAVAQQTDTSCGAACGEMLSGIPQRELIDRVGAPTSAADLAVGIGGRGGYVGPQQLEALVQNGPFAAHLRDGSRLGHFVVVQGMDDMGRVLIRDPWAGGSTYSMMLDEFLRVWNGEAVFR